MRAEHRGRGRLPDDRVAHQRGRGRQVAGDRREVEGRDRVDEALERPVLEPIPDAGRARWAAPHRCASMYRTLKRQKSISSQAESISAWCAVLDWPSIVAALSVCAPRAGEELGGAEEDRGAILPRRPRPVLPGVARRGDRAARPRRRRPCGRRRGRGSAVVRHDRLERVAGARRPRRRSRAGSRSARRRARRGAVGARCARGCRARSRAPARCGDPGRGRCRGRSRCDSTDSRLWR